MAKTKTKPRSAKSVELRGKRLVVCVKGKPRRVSGHTLGFPGTLEVSITTRGGHKQVEIEAHETRRT